MVVAGGGGGAAARGPRRAGRPPPKRRGRAPTAPPPVSVSSLPEGMTLGRGRLEVHFRTVQQLAENLMTLARILDEDPEGFIEAFQPEKTPTEDTAVDDVRIMFQELETMEAGR